MSLTSIPKPRSPYKASKTNNFELNSWLFMRGSGLLHVYELLLEPFDASALAFCVLAFALWSAWASYRLLPILGVVEERTAQFLLLPLLLFMKAEAGGLKELTAAAYLCLANVELMRGNLETAAEIDRFRPYQERMHEVTAVLNRDRALRIADQSGLTLLLSAAPTRCRPLSGEGCRDFRLVRRPQRLKPCTVLRR